MPDGMNRRKFLRVLGVTGGGAAAMAGCSTERVEKLIPYLVPVEDQIPGVATYYASTCRECPAGCGVHVRVREGRAVKLEGNPEHPVNRGKLCARAQAALQGTYNPDRLRGPLARTPAGTFQPVTWDEALNQVVEQLKRAAAGSVWFLTGGEAGSFERLVRDWLDALGSRHAVTFEPFAYEALRQANRRVFGGTALPAYRFADAECVVSFGADFLAVWLSPVEHARGFSAMHGYHDGRMGRYVHVEPRLSLSAMSADEWIAPAPGTEGAVALAMAHVIVNHHLDRAPADAVQLRPLLQPYEPDAMAERTGVSGETIHRLAAEFAARPSVALPGGVGTQHRDAELTAVAVNLLNYVAGNVGHTVVFGPPGGADVPSYAALADLVGAARRNEVGVLFVHGANPAYATPPGLGAAEALAAVPYKVSFARYLDETTALADLVLPDHDPYEQWNDYTPRAGVHALLQPVMLPVFDTRQTGDVLIDLARRLGGAPAARFALGGAQQELYKAYVQQRWRELQREVGDGRPFDEFWREAVQHGGIWREAPVVPARVARGLTLEPLRESRVGPLTAIVYPSATLYDGRGANRPWLQELPDPVTRMTWGTWVEVHPDTAARLAIAEGDVVELRSEAGAIEAPVYLYPGLRPDVVAVPLGQGHTAYGRYARDRGANALRLLDHAPAAFGGLAYYVAVTMTPTGAHVRLAKTEGRTRQLDRGIAQAVTLAGIASGALDHKFQLPEAAPIPEREERTLEKVAERQKAATKYGPYAWETTRWGMAIDLARCTGCSACVAACSAENNIPFVGADQVTRGREMQWIRIERYFEGGEGGGPLEARVLPMLCQQCANAPCEPVCPVFAAYHTADGLNGQAYNRCVGTRYCNNNCPYKVRYFNWYDRANPDDHATFAWEEPLQWLLNPDVTVRSKGVMEKCTFCVQRIRGAQNEARVAGTELKDGDIVTACQQTCPADAIVFGNLTDTGSRVARLAADPRRYRVLESLNTQPAVTYLMKVRNLGEA
jgi:anaerobic selenocysteine-containing dehydrogenase/Fe-S-cluster-containing dehydrogenase component